MVKGVKDNDLFFAMQVRLLIDSRTVGNSNVKVQTWPSPQAFFGSGATPDHLWSIYNAKWSLQVDRVVYIQSELTRRFAKTPPFYTSTQAGIVPGTGITGFAEPINQIIGDTYIDLDPYPIISGRLDNKLTLDVSLFASWNGAANTSLYATTENVISFEFHGFTVKNGSQWMPFFNGQLDVDDPEAVKNYTPGTNV